MGKLTKTLSPGGTVIERFTNIEGRKIVKTAGIPNITRSKRSKGQPRLEVKKLGDVMPKMTK